MAWKAKSDPLFRGDAADAVAVPVVDSDRSLVRPILHMDGYGRETPYMSTTEERAIAATRFAGRRGRVWETAVPTVKAADVGHISNRELQQVLRGTGKGQAVWPSAAAVARARHPVIQHREHLLDFSDFNSEPAVREAVRKVFGEESCSS